jgi:hypothetical protein
MDGYLAILAGSQGLVERNKQVRTGRYRTCLQVAAGGEFVYGIIR